LGLIKIAIPKIEIKEAVVSFDHSLFREKRSLRTSTTFFLQAVFYFKKDKGLLTLTSITRVF
jgi:hypothetical protein